MPDFLNDPRWNLDLLVSTTSTLTSIETSAATSILSEATSSREIPLSTIVYRAVEMSESAGPKAKSFDFNPLILRIHDEFQKFIAEIPDLRYVKAAMGKLVWIVAAMFTTFILLEIGWALYITYTTLPSDPKSPVIPITPGDDIPIPPTPPPKAPKPSNASTKTEPRDIRIKLFSEILTGYLTVILSVSALWGDSLMLQFLLGGLAGFVGMVAFVLPDQAEWSGELYNFKEGGFEMADMADREPLTQEEEEERMKKSILKEMREKVVERIQESPVTKKAKDLLSKHRNEQIPEELPVPPTSPAEFADPHVGSADEDLKAQLSKAMAPVKDLVNTEAVMEKASKKVEEWLMKAGDTFGIDEEDRPRLPSVLAGIERPVSPKPGEERYPKLK
ncbi:hypothetical protein ABW19_dt0207824 [Dactylella cylindrospora]|nr:hypothetical protein ABW19_dt0207824 [Dactylella cylindrospora]